MSPVRSLRHGSGEGGRDELLPNDPSTTNQPGAEEAMEAEGLSVNAKSCTPINVLKKDVSMNKVGWIDVKAWKKMKRSPNPRPECEPEREALTQPNQTATPPPRHESIVIFTELTHTSGYVQDAILNHPTFIQIASYLKSIDQHHQPTWANGGLILVEMELPIDTEGLARICTSKHVILEQQHLGALSQALLTLPSYRRPRLWVELVATSQ